MFDDRIARTTYEIILKMPDGTEMDVSDLYVYIKDSRQPGTRSRSIVGLVRESEQLYFNLTKRLP